MGNNCNQDIQLSKKALFKESDRNISWLVQHFDDYPYIELLQCSYENVDGKCISYGKKVFFENFHILPNCMAVSSETSFMIRKRFLDITIKHDLELVTEGVLSISELILVYLPDDKVPEDIDNEESYDEQQISKAS